MTLPPRRLALEFLDVHHADRIPHLRGTLGDHLVATEEILRSWGCPETLCRAGLCHAAYGTDGFTPSLIAWTARAELVAVAGTAAEQIVYFYAACDRDDLYPQLRAGGGPGDGDGERSTTATPAASPASVRYRDRFLGTETEMAATDDRLRDVVDLTLANEMEIAVGRTVTREAPAWARDLVDHMAGHASAAAAAGARLMLAAAG